MVEMKLIIARPSPYARKARIALLGLEAVVQARNLPDKGTWYRVRLGPYSSVDELNTIRGALNQNGIDTVMVRVQPTDKQ